MIVHWSRILCVLLVVVASCIAACFWDDIVTFLSLILTVNDPSAPAAHRQLGVMAAAIVIFVVGGLMHIATRDARPTQS